MQYSDIFLATTYDCGAYGGGSYDNGTCTSTTSSNGASTTASTSGSGVLTNTGFDILLAVTLGCVLIFAALVVKFWKKPKKLSTDG
jgi:hypothetical protein